MARSTNPDTTAAIGKSSRGKYTLVITRWCSTMVLVAFWSAPAKYIHGSNALYRDVRYVLPFLVQFWMFASPVAYPASLVPERWRLLYSLNPMTGVIEGFRWALTGRGVPPNLLLAVSSAAVLLVVAGGVAYFQKMEGTIADVV